MSLLLQKIQNDQTILERGINNNNNYLCLYDIIFMISVLRFLEGDSV